MLAFSLKNTYRNLICIFHDHTQFSCYIELIKSASVLEQIKVQNSRSNRPTFALEFLYMQILIAANVKRKLLYVLFVFVFLNKVILSKKSETQTRSQLARNALIDYAKRISFSQKPRRKKRSKQVSYFLTLEKNQSLSYILLPLNGVIRNIGVKLSVDGVAHVAFWFSFDLRIIAYVIKLRDE